MRIDIGKIVNTHGVRGELKVLPLTDDVNRYSDLKTVYISAARGTEERKVEMVRYSKGVVFLKLEGIDDADKAMLLRNAVLQVDRKDAVKLPADTYFIFELIGCEAVAEETGEAYGKVTEILKTGSNDVYVVKGEDGKELLIPALKSVIKSISIEEKRIVVKLPETDE